MSPAQITVAATPGRVVKQTHSAARWGFALSVGLVLALSQAWVPLIGGHDGDPEASGLIRVLYLPWYAVAVGLFWVRPRPSLAAVRRSALVWALVAAAAASILWSIDPGVTARRTVAVAFTTLAGVAIGARCDWTELAELLGCAFAVIALGSLAAGLLAPDYGRMQTLFPGAWRGLYYDKNGLGEGMSLAFVVFCACAALQRRRWRSWSAFAALAVLLVLLSQSKTSLISLTVGACVFAGVRVARRGRGWAVAAAVAGIVALAAALGAVLLDGAGLLDLLGKDDTLSGRTGIWRAAADQALQRPWLGYGYGAVWSDDSPWAPLAWIVDRLHFRPRHAHDGWLEVWLGLGAVGVGLWTALFLQTLVRAGRTAWREAAGCLALPVLVVFALESATESVVFTYNDLVWVMFTALAVRLAWPPRRPDAGREARRAVRLASAAP